MADTRVTPRFPIGEYVVPFQFTKSDSLSHWEFAKETAKSHLNHYIKVKDYFRDSDGSIYYLACDSYYSEEDLMTKNDYLDMKQGKSLEVDTSSLLDLI